MTDDLIERYQEHLGIDDDLTIVVLKGHLMIEKVLDRIIECFLPHGQFARQANLRFAQKLQLAQGMCLSKHDERMWRLIAALNALRNDLAHKLQSPEFDNKLNALLSLHLTISATDPDIEGIRQSSPEHQMHFAVCYMLGFLQAFERNVQAHAQFQKRLLESRERIGKELQEDHPEGPR